jgi:hypothetical protein
LGSIIAAIGAELIAVKEALDKLSDKTAWLRWLKDHVHYSVDTAQNYMRVARFAEKNRSASVFFGLDPTVSKQRVLAAIEGLRRLVLKWPAWATPATKKKPTR